MRRLAAAHALAALAKAASKDEARPMLTVVYIGPVGRCPECGAICIHRQGYTVRNLMDGRRCKTCGYELAVVI